MDSDFTRKKPEMFVATTALIVLAASAIIATFAAVARDGYRHIPTR
jgi:hypothetical protein